MIAKNPFCEYCLIIRLGKTSFSQTLDHLKERVGHPGKGTLAKAFFMFGNRPLGSRV